MASAIANQGQWYRLLTPVVLHGSVPHLAVNSLSLNSVGPVVRAAVLVVFSLFPFSFTCLVLRPSSFPVSRV